METRAASISDIHSNDSIIFKYLWKTEQLLHRHICRYINNNTRAYWVKSKHYSWA